MEGNAGWLEDANVTMDGTATAIFTWSPDPNIPNDSPPKTTVVEIDSDAWAAGATGSAVDGWGDAAVQQDSYENPPDPPTNWYSDGTHYERVDCSSGTFEVQADLTVIADNESSDNAANCYGGVYFTASLPNLALDLIRDGAHDETEDSDGNLHGDTTYSYNVDTPDGTIVETNWQTFHPVFAGDWDLPTTSWTWNPNESQDTQTTGLWSIPFGNLVSNEDGIDPQYWSGTPDAPVTKTITYDADHMASVDQNYNIDLQATYYLTFHDEVEGLTDTQSNVIATGPLWGSGGPGELAYIWPTTEGETYSAGSVPITACSSTSNGFSVGGDVDLSKWAKPFGLSVGASYQHSESNSYSIAIPCPFDVSYGFYAYPIFVDVYLRHTFHWRHFDSGGEHILHNADGTVRPHIDVEDQASGGSVDWIGPIPTSTPVPVNPDTTPETPQPDTGE